MKNGKGGPKACASLQEILSECSLDNRLYVLSILDDAPVSVADVRRALIKAGAEKSFATVKRYLDSLRRIGLVEENGGRYRLTNLGFYISTCFGEIRENIGAINAWLEALDRVSISCLPRRFIHDLKVLSSAKFVTDPFSFITELLMCIQKAEKTVDLLADRASYQFFELVGGKVLEGVLYRGICSSKYTQIRQQYAKEFIKKHGINGAQLQSFRKRFLMREYDRVMMHAVVVDDEIAGINFPYRGGRANLDSAFMSTNEEFVRWVKEIIDYYWDESRPVKF
jgi:predicted transcriptional regulator